MVVSTELISNLYHLGSRSQVQASSNSNYQNENNPSRNIKLIKKNSNDNKAYSIKHLESWSIGPTETDAYTERGTERAFISNNPKNKLDRIDSESYNGGGLSSISRGPQSPIKF